MTLKLVPRAAEPVTAENVTAPKKPDLGVSVIRAQMKRSKGSSASIYQWDNSMPGLGMRINTSGKAVYVVKYSLGGKQVLKTFADCSRVTIEQARSLTSRVKMLAKENEDPASLFRTYLTELGTIASGSITFGAFARIFIERYSQVYKKSWKNDRQRIECYMLPIWKDRALDEIKRSDIAALSATIGRQHPTTANRIREQIRVMYRQAIIMGYLPDGHPNPAWGIRGFQEQARDRYVTENEMPRLLQAIDSFPDQAVRTALRLDLMTGLRAGELVSLRWEYIDFDRAMLRLPMTKSGKSFEQPLPPDAVALLVDLPRTSQFVFPCNGRGHRGHISSLRKQWLKIRAAAGLNDVRLHDLRRTTASWIVQVSDILNHSSVNITRKHYARYAQDHKRSALEDHAVKLREVQHGSN